MRYVILKKINNTWYVTRNRYTAKELEVLVDKLYNDVVDFELLNDGECQGLDNGVIIVKDDERELNENGTYLTDDLELEEKKSSNLWVFIVMFALWLFFGFYGIFGFCVITGLIYFINRDNKTPQQYEEEYKEMQNNLPENHKAQGMM
nr:MAG TPA: hypothetical protein [Caudoviricetes sp.]